MHARSRTRRASRASTNGTRNCASRRALGEQRRGVEHELRVHLDLGQRGCRAAARTPASRRRCCRRSRVSRRVVCVGGLLRQRMADVGHRDAGLLVERRLERKQREHAVDARGRSSRSRSRRHAQTDGLTKWMVRTPRALELALETEVEVRRVDADEQRHALVAADAARKLRAGCAPARADARAPRPSRARRASRAETTTSQPAASMRGPGDAGEAHVRQPRAHRVDQRRARARRPTPRPRRCRW